MYWELMQIQIKVTVCLENSMWVGIFERVDAQGLAAARVIFGKEPTDPELYEWIKENYQDLNFSSPQQFKLVIKRKNPKRMLREIKKELAKSAGEHPKESLAQEAMRLETEKLKKQKKSSSKAEKEAEEKRQFELRQAKKKEKLRGH